MTFDPYHKWLGIPPREQPPNHYRLLGIAEFESDADVIEAAADQRMSFLQSLASGPHVDDSQRLLNEVAAARLCLLNPDRKSEYDRRLQGLPGGPPPLPPGHPPDPPQQTGGTRRLPTWIWITAGGTAGVLSAALVIGLLVADREPPPEVIIVWPLKQREGAELLLDGTPRELPETRDVKLSLSPGEHRIEMHRTGYRPILRRDLTVVPGRTIRLRLNWKKAVPP